LFEVILISAQMMRRPKTKLFDPTTRFHSMDHFYVSPQPVCTALHCTALHCMYCTALHCTALHCTTLHCTALHSPEIIIASVLFRRVVCTGRSVGSGVRHTLHYTTPHYTTLHCNTLHYTTLQYNTIQYKYTTLQYTTPHYNTILL
jgi:hypothetical protein